MTETTLFPQSVEPQEIVYRDRNQKIQIVTARFDGFNKKYYVSDCGQRAALLVVHNGDVLFVRQYRLLINGLSYEIPGGKIDEGESPEVCAVRECFEETGVKCSNIRLLLSYHTSLDIHKDCTYIFCTEESEEMPVDNPERRVWIPLARCIDMIFAQQIVDSLSIIGLLAYYNRAFVKRSVVSSQQSAVRFETCGGMLSERL